jgi:hypothetical protein
VCKDGADTIEIELGRGQDAPAPGRRQLIGAELEGGALLAVPDAREVSWPVDLAKRAVAISRCETGWVLLWDGGQFRPSPMLCGDRVCPRCMRARVGRIAHYRVPVLQAAHEDKAAIYMITTTQPTKPGAGALVLPHERRRYIGESPVGEVRAAVGGESLGAAYGRWRDHFQSVRKDRSTKHRWKSALGGYVYGIEATLRAKKARGPQVPRWHVHGHILAVVPGGWRNFDATWRQLRRDWLDEVPGAKAIAQDCRRVAPRGDETMADALLEVMKYPIKVTDLTVAAMIEAYGALRGTKPHHIGGSWHGNALTQVGLDSKGKPIKVPTRELEPWRSWLAAAPEPPSWPRLQYRPSGDRPWEVYCGQAREGMAQWSIDEKSGPRIWECDARVYWRQLSEARASHEIFDRALVDEDA